MSWPSERSAVGSDLLLSNRLGGALPGMRGYDARYDDALARARASVHGWVDSTDVNSCHRVWFELHEDLLATLGLDRGREAAR